MFISFITLNIRLGPNTGEIGGSRIEVTTIRRRTVTND